jgi:hypothetical protein
MALRDLTARQVEEILENYVFSGEYTISWGERKGETQYWERSGDWDHIKEESEGDGFYLPELGRVSLVTDFGGEGQGDGYWFVVKIVDGDVERLFRKDGYWQSYEGGEYDGDLREVKAVVKPVTFYE